MAQSVKDEAQRQADEVLTTFSPALLSIISGFPEKGAVGNQLLTVADYNLQEDRIRARFLSAPLTAHEKSLDVSDFVKALSPKLLGIIADLPETSPRGELLKAADRVVRAHTVQNEPVAPSSGHSSRRAGDLAL